MALDFKPKPCKGFLFNGNAFILKKTLAHTEKHPSLMYVRIFMIK